jgi:transposase
VIRVSQWSEIRYLVEVERVPKREVARRLSVNIKTVRRALSQSEPRFRRRSPPRGRKLDMVAARIEELLKQDRRLTSKRISDLLREEAGAVSEREWRKYVAKIRVGLFPREAFVDRSATAGDTAEFDFGESAAIIAGRVQRVKYLVAALPCSNAYFAKAYPVERLECLMDGIVAAFLYFGGVTRRGVLDNTSLAVREVLAGPDRVENRTFEGFRGQFPLHADFCAPRKGWEKGSVEGGVGYVRDNVFRPMPTVASFDELNAMIVTALEADLDRRHVRDGRSVRAALDDERKQLRPIPQHLPQTCRVSSRVADKFGYVHIDRVAYSIPIELAYRPVICKLFHDRIEIANEDKVVAVHARSFNDGDKVIEPRHVLSLLERKHRAVSESTALQQWKIPEVFHRLRAELEIRTRKPDREWVSVLRLLEQNDMEDVVAAVEEALANHTPRLESIRSLLRRRDSVTVHVHPIVVSADLAAIEVAPPKLEEYDDLVKVVAS